MGSMKYDVLAQLTEKLHSVGSTEYFHPGLYEAKDIIFKKSYCITLEISQVCDAGSEKTNRLFPIREAQRGEKQHCHKIANKCNEAEIWRTRWNLFCDQWNNDESPAASESQKSNLSDWWECGYRPSRIYVFPSSLFGKGLSKDVFERSLCALNEMFKGMGVERELMAFTVGHNLLHQSTDWDICLHFDLLPKWYYKNICHIQLRGLLRASWRGNKSTVLKVEDKI